MRTSHAFKGFTLIELLVVIAIIAILAAILFPVFARAREKARQTTCSSNQRQIAASAMMYAQDHDETLPATASFWASINVDPGVLVCPTLGKTTPNGYIYNAQLSGAALGTLADPASVHLTADGNAVSGTVPNIGLTVGDVTARHSNQVIYSFTDGHVAASPLTVVGPTSGLLGYWPLTESGGTTATSLYGTAGSGTYGGGVTHVAGPSGMGLLAAHFPLSSTGYVQLPASLNTAYQTSYTLAAWFRPDGIPSGVSPNWLYGIMVWKGYHVGPTYNNDQSISCTIYQSGPTGVSVGGATKIKVAPGTWFHVAVTVNYTTGVLAMFVNGLQVDSTTFNKTYATNTVGPLYIGSADPGNTTGYTFDALADICEARFYNRALNQGEVQQLAAYTAGF